MKGDILCTSSFSVVNLSVIFRLVKVIF